MTIFITTFNKIVKAFTFTWLSTKQHRDLHTSKTKSLILASASLFSFCGSGKTYCLYDNEKKMRNTKGCAIQKKCATKGLVKVRAWKKEISGKIYSIRYKKEIEKEVSHNVSIRNDNKKEYVEKRIPWILYAVS